MQYYMKYSTYILNEVILYIDAGNLFSKRVAKLVLDTDW